MLILQCFISLDRMTYKEPDNGHGNDEVGVLLWNHLSLILKAPNFEGGTISQENSFGEISSI